MTLSNIFREPRREITESAVGLAIFGVAIWADYEFAVWLQDYAGYYTGANNVTKAECPWPLGMMLGMMGTIALTLGTAIIMVASHALGDAVCNALQARGIHLRPKRRY